jgi:microcystin-dependent protein
VTGATDITVSTPAILSISGVFPANTTGDVNFVGTGMIDVIPFANSSTVQVDGSAIVTTLTTLQNMDIMQEAQIMNISSIVSSLQTQVNSVQMAGDMVAQALNGTVITFNMTLVELITEVMQAQAAIAALQAQLANFTTTAVPTGSVFAWGGSAMGPYPSGYLLCDGASYPTTSFPELFGIIANMYGGSMGFFNVPDLRGKVVAGKGGSVLNVVVGTSVGTETHTLTTAEMPAHNHHNNIVPSPPPANGDTGGVAAHKHELPKYRATVSISGGQPVGASPAPPGTCMSGTGLAIDNCVGATNYEQPILLTATPGDPDAQTSEENAHTHTIAPNGQSNAHPNIQPTLVMQYIIKT